MRKEYFVLADVITNEADNMQTEFYLAHVCMLLEEYCKAKNLDMVKTLESMLDSAREVNEEFGKY